MNTLKFTKGMAAPCLPRRSPDWASDGGSEGTAQANPESIIGFLAEVCESDEEMEKRSRQRVRDQVALMAFGAERE
jgi:hypothetical protein